MLTKGLKLIPWELSETLYLQRIHSSHTIFSNKGFELVLFLTFEVSVIYLFE